MKIIGKMFVLAAAVLSLCCANVFAAEDETYDKLKIMVDVMEIINANYVSETESKELAVGAIKGVVRTLDPFSQYMEENDYKEMKNETEGSYSGIGLRIMVKNGFITVVSPIPGTPAYKAGVLPEDRIIKIDDKSAINMSSDEAVGLMRGKAGTKVKVTMARDSIKQEVEFELTREKIKIETVKYTMLEDKTVYIRLSEFNAQSAADIQKALADYSKQGMKALVLDLRNNPGGLLDSAIDICSMFIKERTVILTTKGRVEEMKKEYYSKGKGEYTQIPFVILVNRGSASASEIVSGAMQDLKRALIIGANTFGKGSVQSVIPLSDGSALRLTIAKYYLPSGRPIVHSDEKNARNGITPDIEIAISPEDEVRLYAQSEMIFSKDKAPKSKVEDKEKIEDIMLNKALELIRENKVRDIIANPKLAVKETKEIKEAKEKEAKEAEEAKEEQEEEVCIEEEDEE
ncbi:MAG: S41 family peptidase [Endomicrobium sp.]|jgi:carboxyl-terminal processing protease|nr:S41 family peptidase [Endomicrobium sp.]